MKQKFLYCFFLLNIWGIIVMAQAPSMIFIEGGSFTMGGTLRNQKPAHNVTVGSFNMGKYEVTVAEFKAFCAASGHAMPAAPAWGWNDKHPMVNVNFDDCNAYCKWLSETTGKNYRLPTEAEWEYAARGGNKTHGYLNAGSDSLDKVGWSNTNSGGQTQPCGSKKANELGLYDMSGNAWEWCGDWFGEYSNSPATNSGGPSSGEYRVLRGGSWAGADFLSQVAFRGSASPANRYFLNGFRVVISQ